jgi:NitT/TauT family transport system ATP-binding protein
LDRSVILQALELDFNQQEAPMQLETAINWGRYAELFSFDDDTDHVFLGTSLQKVESGEADPTLHSID